MDDYGALVDEAVEVLDPVIRRTALEYSEVLSSIVGSPVWLKLEFLQVTGSFKIRGAYYALWRLRQSGVRKAATCSAGNHGLGVAEAARLLDMQAVIHVPASVDATKARLLEGLGADVRVSRHQGFDRTEIEAMEGARNAGLPWVSAYDDPVILAGNGGTTMREMRDQLPDVETVVAPVGGGGLSGGMMADSMRPSVFIAAQAAASPALRLSLDRGEAVTRLPEAATMASGLEGGIGRTGFEVLRRRVTQTIQVEESGIAEGMRWMLKHHRYLIEPSSAVALAALLRPGIRVSGPTIAVLTGRNVSPETLRSVLVD